MKTERGAVIRSILLRWYGSHARSLPWRRNQDAYAIWISEVMLQQTQIATVIPYYERFLDAFPDFSSLARARYEKIVERWSGLGYYRRARHLHLAARKIVKEFGGRFPADYQQARTLPGVGHYTACAVLSMAYQLALPVLDGNVARVLARLNGWKGNLQCAKFRRSAETELQRLIPDQRAGDFNQAMMELGQTVCLPVSPRCTICPLEHRCVAHREGRPEAYPQPRARRAVERRHLAAAVIRHGGRIALVRGLDDGLLSDLWNFPAAFGKSKRQARNRLKARLKERTGSPVRVDREAGSLLHNVTFRSIQVTLYPVDVVRPAEKDGLRWFSPKVLDRAAVSQLARKIVALVPTLLSGPAPRAEGRKADRTRSKVRISSGS